MTSLSKYLYGIAALASIGAAGHAAEPSYNELEQRIDQLQAKVDQLERNQSETVSAKEVDATVERVINDAEQRSQLLQVEGFTAGYTKGKFIIQDAGGNWVLNPFLQFQYQYVTNYRSDGKHSSHDSDVESGFEVRRMKFGFAGNAVNPNLSYFFRWNTAFNTGAVSLEEAWIRYQLDSDWAVRAGQMTNPVFREQTVQSGKKLAVERSLVNILITGVDQGYTQAITLQYDQKGGPITAEFGIEDGFNSINSDFTDPNAGGKSDWGVTGRANYFVTGDRKSYDDFTALGVKNNLLVVGAGGDITQNGDVTNYLHTADIQWKNSAGLSIYGAYIADYINDGGAGDSTYNWGFLAQAGYLLNDKWEIFGRYDYANLDASGRNEFCELTVGVNWYFSGGHNGKVTADLTYLPNGSPSDQPGLGILASSDAEMLARVQFQLVL